MKTTNLFTLFALSAIFLFTEVAAQTVTLPRAASPAAKVSQTIGISKITIKYSRPSVNEREIWGKLVHTGFKNLGFGTAKESPWRAGANENTTITFSHDATIEGKPIAAGTYGLFLAVGENQDATLILSKDHKAWGSYFYDPSNDALRADIKTEEIPMTERLTYDFIDIDDHTATVILDWEKRRFPFKVAFEVPEIVYASLQDELKGSTGFTDLAWNAAANYLLQHKIHLDDALVWSESAISAPFIGQENFNNLQLKSQILAAQGKTAEAEKVMTKALAHPTANANNYYNYGRVLIGTEQDQKALEVFQKLNKKWPDHWLAPHGLARGYAALGDFKKALKFERVALQKAPDGSKQFLEDYVKKLEAGEDFN
ncbi:DUF2911 domain-containing protein [Fulvivirgaceae bacterium BMA12]|uniref:DUF2911 domain-containing protein n=1 Tax=Agaribacillus aureus TaxID=3051825 RepID=A0ABT8KZT6_9BACT|nr:DUF2911 domain-containing protein [Fulvivirgaceae bacterium BMA12]